MDYQIKPADALLKEFARKNPEFTAAQLAKVKQLVIDDRCAITLVRVEKVMNETRP